MSQQRECCCETEEYGIECISGDKISRDRNDEKSGQRKLYSWKTKESGFNTQLIEGAPRVFSRQSTRTNPPQSLQSTSGSNMKNQWATTGDSCMLCNHSLIMSTKRPVQEVGGYLEKLYPGTDPDICPSDTSPCNQKFYYYYGSVRREEEEEINTLYLHWKDYWIMEPVYGIPYTYFNEGPSLTSLGESDAMARGVGTYRNLGQLKMGLRTSQSAGCQTIQPFPTDANYMCMPELKRTTNPLNPWFQIENGSQTSGTIENERDHDRYLEAAWYGCYNSDTEPEMINVCSATTMNQKAFQIGPPGTTDDDTFGDCRNECGGLNNPGFSSWQMYMMSQNPQLRTLSDIITFGNGIPLHATLRNEDALDSDQDSAYWTNLYGSTIGILHRVRLWVRADRAYVNSSDGLWAYPCSTGFGSYDPNDPYANELGSCCIPGGPCIDDITRENCEEGYLGSWVPSNFCAIEPGKETEFCGRVNGDEPGGGDQWETECGVAIDDGESFKITCKDRINPILDPDSAGINCGSQSCDGFNGVNTCKCSAVNGPTAQGRAVAYHPPLVNRKMLHRRSSAGGYTPCEKQRGGPWGIMYYCSGVPVFAEEAIDILPPEQQNQLYKWLSQTEECTPGGGLVDCDCAYMGNISEALGNSGKFNAKDWRPDQLEKYNTLEFEFHRIAAENENDEFPPPTQFQTVEVPASIRQYITPSEDSPINNELLPVQKTGENFLHAYINLSLGKEQVKNNPLQPKISNSGGIADGPGSRPTENDWQLTEMGDYQVTGGDDNVFDISKIDPWHPSNTGIFPATSNPNESWPALGTERERLFPITLNSTNGVDGEFEFRYPVREVYEAFYPPDSDRPFDSKYIPEWEEEMFKAWYSNIALYFHTVPGGWSWSGTGWGVVPKNYLCQWGTEAVASSPFAVNSLPSLYHISKNTIICRSGIVGGAAGCCSGDSCDNCSVHPTDPFPNNPRLIEAPSTAGELNGYIAVSDLQLRDLDGILGCRTIDEQCAGLASGFQFKPCGEGDEDDPLRCCEKTVRKLRSQGSEECENRGVCDNELNNMPSDCCVKGLAPNGFINTCTSFQSYPDQGLSGLRSHTNYIRSNNPKVITNTSSVGEIDGWNRNHPNSKLTASSCRGLKCSETGGCGPLCKCCCPNGCDGDCFCIGGNEVCSGTTPCTEVYGWNSPCCEAYGSCCYIDSDGNLKCQDNVSKEQCTSQTSVGGLNGIFNETELCADFPCLVNESSLRTSGACCYVNNFTKNTDCVITSNTNCTTLGGTWTDGASCSDISCDKTENTFRIGLDDPINCQLCGDPSNPRVRFQSCCKSNGVCTSICFVDNLQCELCDGALGDTCGDAGCDTPLGACCFPDGSCQNNVTETACIVEGGGSWRGEDVICGDVTCNDGGGGDDCTGCIGYGEACMPPGFVGYGSGLATQHTGGGPCRFKLHDSVKSCIVRHYQASAHAFRIVSYVSSIDTLDNSGSCPSRFANPAGNCACCSAREFTLLCPSPNTCGESAPGGVPNPLGLFKPPHNRKGEIVCNIYPYKLRCLQVRDINGFLKCGLLQSEISINEEEFIDRLPRVLLGLVDPLTCNTSRTEGECNPLCDDCFFENTECCDPEITACEVDVDDDGPDLGFCTGDNTTGCGDTIPSWSYRGGCRINSFENKIPSGGALGGDDINDGGACMSYERGALLRARSFIPRETIPFGAFEINTPRGGLPNVPSWACPRITKENRNELPRPLAVPAGTLDTCADFWKDKELSKFNTTLAEQTKGTEIIFKDYDDLGVQAPCGINFQFVDNDRQDAGWENFWLKQDYPDIENIRLFSVGCWNIDGGFEGGREGISGGFAGTMVLNFKNEGSFRSFDAQQGHRNLKFEFNTNDPGGNTDASFGNKKFVARPSRNPRWREADHDELELGWIGGRGITYANFATGTGNPETGKVYQFCAETADQDDGSLKPYPYKPFPNETECNPVTYSGSRGPITLLGNNEFSVTITEFNDRAGVTDGAFVCCQESTLGNNGWESCSSCGCENGDCGDFGGDDPVCNEESSCEGS